MTINDNFIYENDTLTGYTGNRTEIIIPENIKTIGESVFKGMKEIERIVLPEGLISIKANAFKGCKKLKNINFPSGLEEIGDYAFHRCHSLESAVLPESVKILGNCAFLYCDNIKSVSITGIKHIRRQTFANNTSLTELSLNSELETSNLGDDIFTGCIKINKIMLSDGRCFNIPNLIKAIDSDNNIVSSVAKGVYKSMKLENGMLYKFCVNLKDVTIPEGITGIEKSCFYDKKGIVSISLPKSLERIKANAFGNCINLKCVSIQNSNIIIDENAFKGCNNLSEIILEDKIFNIDSPALPIIIRKIREQILSDFYISGKTLISYRGSEERIKIPKGIKIISESCFEGNEKIGRVIFPDTVKEIRENAFKGCTSLQTAELSENLRIIGESAFENCNKLIKTLLPENTRRIEKSAFKRCFRLNCFEINSNLEYIGDMAFYGCKELKDINIPKQTKLDGDMIFLKSGLDKIYTKEIIQPYRFSGDESITELVIDNFCIIDRYAYSGCKNLKTIIINNPECIIKEFAFEKCTSLKNIYIKAKSIEKGAFSFCTGLESIIIDTESIGELAFFECGKLKNIELSENTEYIGKRCFEECVSIRNFPFENIKYIGEKAFARCEGFEKVTLPCSVGIGYHAFEDCCNLRETEISSQTYTGSGVFYSCTNINRIILDGKLYTFDKYSQSINNISNIFPERVQELIGDIYSCFEISENFELLKYNGNSQSVKIPRDVISVGDEAFRDCIRCSHIDIPESVKYIGKLAFSGTKWLSRMRQTNRITVINNLLTDAAECGEYIEIPAEIKRICSWSFAGNCKLKEIKFLGDRTVIDEYAFRNCIGLRKITLSDGNSYMLENINSADNIDIPCSVRKIFRECVNCFKTDNNGNLIESTGNIKNLVFINGIKSISDGVYKDCNLLESITLSDDTEEIGKNAFENSKWLRHVNNAVGIKKIGDFAFSGCQSLESIELSGKLKYIGKRSFEHCCMLEEIFIPEGITEIYERTFFRCKSLKKIILPSTLKNIGKEAFAFCDNLKHVVVYKNTYIDENAFKWSEPEVEYI